MTYVTRKQNPILSGAVVVVIVWQVDL